MKCSKSIRAGFIGTGEIARVHAQVLQKLGGVEITAAYDLDPVLCGSFCKCFGGTVIKSADELIASPAVDAVYICTHHDTHASLATAAMEQGKAVFLEKPAAMSFQSAKGLCAKQFETGARCAVGFNMRFSPAILELKKLFREKGVCPLTFRASMICPPFSGGWASDPIKGGGVLVCFGSHMFDLISHVLGSEIAWIYAQTSHLIVSHTAEPDSAAIVLEMKNGVCGTLLMNDRADYVYSMEPGEKMIELTICSEAGTFTAEAYGKICYADASGLYEIMPPGGLDRNYRWGYQEENQQFLRMIRGEETEMCSLSEGAAVAAAVDTARLSAREQRRVGIEEITA